MQPIQTSRHALAGRAEAEADVLQQVGQETAHTAVARFQREEIDVIDRTDQRVDLFQGLFQGSPRQVVEQPGAHVVIADRAVQHDLAGGGERRGRPIQVFQAAHAGFLVGPLRIAEQVAQQGLQDFQGVVVRSRLQAECEGHQCRHPARRRQPINRGDLGGVGEARQGRDTAGRDVRRRWQGDADAAHVIEPAQCPNQCGATDHHRAGAQLVQPGAAVAFGHRQQVVQLLSLRFADAAAEGEPETFLDPTAQLGDKALQLGNSRQEDFLCEQPRGGSLKQHARPVGARPAEGIQPAAQAKADTWIGEMTIAKAVLNIGGMYPAAMIAIALKAVRIGDCQLAAKHLQDFQRHSGGLVRQNAHEADGGQQNGITQTVMVTPQHLDGLAIFIAQVKVTFQFLTAGCIDVATKTVALLLGQKTDRH